MTAVVGSVAGRPGVAAVDAPRAADGRLTHRHGAASQEPSVSSPAGWYPDPADTSVRRWWDGRRWTGRLAKADERSEGGSVSTDAELSVEVRPWRRNRTRAREAELHD